MKVGIDIGGSHIGIGLVNDGGLIGEKYEYDLTDKDRLDIISCIEDKIISVLTDFESKYKSKIMKIGIGIPGVVQGSIIKYSVNLGITNYDIVIKLQNAFPYAKIIVRNDAKCAALAEKRLGALKNFEEGIFLCLGTGVGGATFYKGELIKPYRSSGFEFGHMIINKNGRLCRCGNKGCFESYASMRVFKNNIRNVFNLDSSIDGKELLNIIKNNIDNECVKIVINEFIQDLTIGISNVINALEPQVVCIGGGFTYYGEVLFEKFKEYFNNNNNVFFKENIPLIVLAELGNDAGIIGSALYI